MFERFSKEEPNFIEKRRQWKGGLDKPVGKRTLMMIMPAIILAVFALLSAPYLKAIFETFAKDKQVLDLKPLNLEDEPEKVEEEGPPPSPEQAMGEYYREQFDKEGFDYSQKPQVEAPDLSYAKEQPISIEAPQSELPATMLEINELRESHPAPSE